MSMSGIVRLVDRPAKCTDNFVERYKGNVNTGLDSS